MQCPIVNSIFKLMFPVLLYCHFSSHFSFYTGVAGLSQQPLKIPPCLYSVSVFPFLSLPMKLFVQIAADIHVCTCMLHIFSSVFFQSLTVFCDWQNVIVCTQQRNFIISLLLHFITFIVTTHYCSHINYYGSF